MSDQRDIVDRIMDYDTCQDTDIDDAAQEILRLRAQVEKLNKERAELLSFAVEAECISWRPAEDGEPGCWYYDSCGETLGKEGEPWGKAKDYLEQEKEQNNEAAND